MDINKSESSQTNWSDWESRLASQQEKWDRIYNELPEPTRRIKGFFLEHDFFKKPLLNNPHLDANFSMNLSYLFLKGVMHSGIYQDNFDMKPEQVMCLWLRAAYEALLTLRLIEPNSAAAELTLAIINHTDCPHEAFDLAHVNDAGEVVFAGASRLSLIQNSGGIKIALEQKTPFVYHFALNEGFKRILCAAEKVNDMRIYLDVRKFSLEDKKDELLNVITSLHQTGALSTSKKILGFDFKENIVNFIANHSGYKNLN